MGIEAYWRGYLPCGGRLPPGSARLVRAPSGGVRVSAGSGSGWAAGRHRAAPVMSTGELSPGVRHVRDRWYRLVRRVVCCERDALGGCLLLVRAGTVVLLAAKLSAVVCTFALFGDRGHGCLSASPPGAPWSAGCLPTPQWTLIAANPSHRSPAARPVRGHRSACPPPGFGPVAGIRPYPVEDARPPPASGPVP